jgi:2-polyprenyl-6-methoxyphenol hydroxylase-like FAD-dependent oxidoreductase
LLPRGDRILEQLFPGYVDDLLASGAYSLEGKRTAFLTDHGPITIDLPLMKVSWSRPLLEWVIRQRVQALPRVQLLTNQEVIGLYTNADQTRVTGISIRQRGHLDEQTILQADLVIDASGRTSKLTQWLEALGYEVPENEQVHSSIGYSTRLYQLPEGANDEWGAVGGLTEHGGMMGISHVENRTFIVGFGMIGGAYPPTDVAGFEHELALHFGAVLSDVLQDAQPLGDPRGYRIPVCVRHHFEQMDVWPAGLLVMGDALCNFDPIYGQGMSVAAIEAETLAQCLDEQSRDSCPAFEHHVLEKMQEAISPAWWLSSIADLSVPGVSYTGPAPLKGAHLVQAYLNLYRKYALQPDQAQLQREEISQIDFSKYFMMQGLLLPPRAVINMSALTTLLTSDPSSEEQGLLAEFCQHYPDHFEDMLSEVVPDFAGAFGQDQSLANAQVGAL